MAEERYRFEGPQALRAPIAEALARVVDPEIGLDIVEVGLVHAVEVRDDVVHLRMTMTSAACPLAEVIVSDIEDELDRVLPEGMRIRVEIVWEPAWTPQRMGDDARRIMGW